MRKHGRTAMMRRRMVNKLIRRMMIISSQGITDKQMQVMLLTKPRNL